MGAGITLLRAWANTGSRVSTPNSKIDVGWLPGEQPACEYENERQYERDTTTNAIATYINDGVPLSDLLPGSVVLGGTDNSIQMGNDISYHAIMAEDRFRAFDPDKTSYTSLESDGLQIEGEDGSRTKSVRPVIVDLSGLSWSHLGGTTYYSSGAIGLVDLDFLTSNVILGMSICGYISSTATTEVGSVQWFRMSNGSPETVLSNVGVSIGADPATAFDTLHLTITLGRRLASANV